jgi:Leucine rich repeat
LEPTDGYRLTGSFPVELTKLDYLRDISLTHNEFKGTLPRELAQMKHLTDIELQRNQFTGTIPDEWFGAKNLIHINFATNQIKGTVPTEFGLLTDLQRFFIQNNLLSGTLPLELFTMTSLSKSHAYLARRQYLKLEAEFLHFFIFISEWIFLGNNNLRGTLPTEFGLLTNVEYFYTEGNQLTGTLPSEVAKLTEMREFDLHDTMLSGTIPEELYAEMSVINSWDFTNANFEGTLSTRVGMLQMIDWFLLGDNNLSGTIPEQVGKMESVNRFQIQGNRLTGSIPMSLCMHRGIGTLNEVIADCSSISTGETPVFCPSGCCTECCNQDTGICLPAST